MNKIQRKFFESKGVFEEALSIYKESYKDSNHLDTAKVLLHLGFILAELNDFTGAKEKYEKAKAIGIDNFEGQNLDDLKDWTEIVKNIACFDKDYRIVEAMDKLQNDDEIMEMSDSEFAIRVGGARTKSDFIMQSNEAPKKPKAVVFDDLDGDDYGITAREYGEMLAYNPPLRDLALAKKVKDGKARGESLSDIASRINEGLSLVKHYSAALSRGREETPS